MSRGIEVSKKHGVNPTIPICFWCGEDKNEIALLGRIREKDSHTGRAVRGSDIEAPMKMVLDYEPCDKCAEAFSKGVHLIECTNFVQDTRPAMSKDENGHEVFPTGRSAVITPEVAQQVFNIDKSLLEAGKKLCLPQEVFNQLMQSGNN